MKPSIEGIEGHLDKALRDGKIELPFFRLTLGDMYKQSGTPAAPVAKPEDEIELHTTGQTAQAAREGKKPDFFTLTSESYSAVEWERFYVIAAVAKAFYSENATGLFPRRDQELTTKECLADAREELEKHYAIFGVGNPAARLRVLDAIAQKIKQEMDPPSRLLKG